METTGKLVGFEVYGESRKSLHSAGFRPELVTFGIQSRKDGCVSELS